MKNILSSVARAATIALAASTVSFAGPGLADGAAKFVGNITTRGQVRSDFGTYWNQITAENECKWASIEGTRGNRNFSGCKAAYNWAKNNGGHFSERSHPYRKQPVPLRLSQHQDHPGSRWRQQRRLYLRDHGLQDGA